ncbi:hypothetical protein GCM10027592_36050 [Spirosoma flavus]
MNHVFTRILLLGFLLVSTQTTKAQNAVIDSMRHRLYVPMPDTSRIYVYYDVVLYFYKRNQLDSTTLYLEKMLPICQRARFKAGLGYYEMMTGLLDRIRGNYETAVTHLQKALTLYEQSTMPSDVGMVYISLGYLYKQMGEIHHLTDLNRKAIHYLLLGVPINKASPVLYRLVQNYINLGINYEDLNEMETAHHYYLLAQERAEKIPDGEDFLRTVLNNIGNLYLKRRKPEQAIPYLKRSLAINQKLRRPSSMVHNYRNLSTAYLDINQPKIALDYAHQALATLPQTNDATLSPSVLRVLRQALAATGQYQQAYEYFLKEKLGEDSLLTIQKAQAITKLQGQYEQKKAQELAAIQARLELEKTREVSQIEAHNAREIAQIEADRKRRVAQITAQAEVEKTRAVTEVQTRYETAKKSKQIVELDQQNTRRMNQMAYLGGGLGLVLLLLGVSVAQYRTIRKTNGKLVDQNQIIVTSNEQLAEQSDQLRTLIRELHHRVKNNLAIVSGLLSLQTYRLTDSGAIEAMQESQRRVEAMALIHQRLYRTDKTTAIDMAAYITELADGLRVAYGYEPDGFDLTVQVSAANLDVDVAIPLGLILNELLTNSFKYAYAQRSAQGEKPVLLVALHGKKELTLEVQDNGPGVDLNIWQNPDVESTSFGRQLVWALTEQLEGNLSVLNRPGAYFRLTIPRLN